MKNAAKMKRIKITAVDVIKPMISLLLINILILTIWTVIDPLGKKFLCHVNINDYYHYLLTITANWQS